MLDDDEPTFEGEMDAMENAPLLRGRDILARDAALSRLRLIRCRRTWLPVASGSWSTLWPRGDSSQTSLPIRSVWRTRT